MNDKMSNINTELLRISEYSLDEEGNLLSVAKQKELQEQAKFWLGEDFESRPYIIKSSTLNLNVPELSKSPLIFSNKSLKHIWKKHAKDFSFDAFISLVENISSELDSNVLSFQDNNDPKKICFVLDKASRNKNSLICVVLTKSDIAGVKVNKISSIHGKQELLKKIQDSINKELNIYTNKRTGNWLARTEMDIFNGANSRSTTSQYLYDLYYKQNHVKSQGEKSSSREIDDRNAIASDVMSNEHESGLSERGER